MAPYTPLLRPRRYFAASEVNFFRVMAVVAVLLFTGPLAVYGIGWVITDSVDGTVTVDNPERPPDFFCEDRGGCEEPEQIEQDVDTVIWDVMDRFVGPAFLAYPLILGVLTLLLHGGVWVVGGDRGWFPTLAVAAWGLLPTVAIVAVSIAGLWLTIDPVTVSPNDDIGVALAPLEDQFRAFGPYRTVGTIVASIWGGLIWRAGLAEHQGLPNMEATLVAGMVATLYAAGAILL